MIDEAEPLGYPVVVKSTRGHRGQCPLPRLLVGRQVCGRDPRPRAAEALLRETELPLAELVV